MVEQIIAVILGMLPGIASTAVIALCVAIKRNLGGFIAEHKALVKHLNEEQKKSKNDEAQTAALREILGDMLDQEHKRLVGQGYASPLEKEKFENKYKAYHALGGNGTRTSHYNDVMEMRAYAIGRN